MAISVGFAFMIGYYLLFTARRIGEQPEDNKRGRDQRRRGGARLLQPAQLVAAVRLPGGRAQRVGIVIGWWLFLIGVFAVIMA